MDLGGENSPPTTPKTGDGWESPPNIADASISRLKASSLKDIDSKTLESFLLKKKDIESKVSSQFAEKAIPAGIYKDEGQIFWVCPESFFSEDNIIGMMIIDFAVKTGARIKVIPSDVSFTQSYDETFITGLWFGIDSTTNQRRSRAKKSYELGRTCTFSLIVKNVFSNTKELGVKALVRDNFFFGNNPDEVENKSKVPFLLKGRLRSFFNDAKWGDFLFGIINFTTSFVGFANLIEKEQDKVISSNLVPLDQLITSCYPTTLVKKGRKEEKKVRKPNPIRSSPLYLREEMEFIHDISSPLFTDLADLSNQYEDSVLAHGYDYVESYVRAIIKTRWETLQRFANRTKLRLQAIRKIEGNTTLKKANVTRTQVESLLNNIHNPVASLVEDIFHIIGASRSPKDLVGMKYKVTFSSESESRKYLYSQVYRMYMKVLSDQHQLRTAAAPEEVATTDEADFHKAMELFMKIRKTLANLKKNLLGISNISEYKLVGRFNQITSLTDTFLKSMSDLRSLSNDSADAAIKMVTDGKYKDSDEAQQAFYASFDREIRLALFRLRDRLKENRVGEAKNLTKEFINRTITAASLSGWDLIA